MVHDPGLRNKLFQRLFQLVDLSFQVGAIGQARGRAQIQPACARHRDGAGVEPWHPALVGGDGGVLQLEDNALLDFGLPTGLVIMTLFCK